jgi:predicted nucleic acid-binding protein
MIVLDTNIISELVKSSPDRNVRAWFRREAESNLYLNSIVVMEQSFGAERSGFICARVRTGIFGHWKIC